MNCFFALGEGEYVVEDMGEEETAAEDTGTTKKVTTSRRLVVQRRETDEETLKKKAPSVEVPLKSQATREGGEAQFQIQLKSESELKVTW